MPFFKIKILKKVNGKFGDFSFKKYAKRGNLRFLRKNSLEYTSKILTGGMEVE